MVCAVGLVEAVCGVFGLFWWWSIGKGLSGPLRPSQALVVVGARILLETSVIPLTIIFAFAYYNRVRCGA